MTPFFAVLAIFPTALRSETWDSNPESDVSGYTIYIGTSRDNLSPYRTVTKDTLSYTLTGLAPGRTYYCSVQAFNSTGVQSGMSPQISYTTPPASATAAEIALSDSEGNHLINGTTALEFGAVTIETASRTETIVIRNEGFDTLSGLAISVGGLEAEDFQVSSPAVTSLAPGASTTFDVTFVPGGFGSRQGSISIVSNDLDENPFVIPVNGEGIAPVIADSPELTILKSDGSDLVNGNASLVFPSLLPGVSSLPQVITVKNTGNLALSGLGLTIAGSHSADFTVSPLLVNTLAAGASTTFAVIFKPGASGNRHSTIHLYSNDVDENPFDIALSGTGTAVPDITVANSSGTDLTDGSATITFGSINLDASPAPKILTLKNTGSSALSGLSLSVTGSHASDFTVSSVTSSLGANSSTTITVAFDPSAAGTRSAVLRIASNDPDENPFDINLSGVGVAVPEIAVATSSGLDLADNGVAVSFGSLVLGPATSTQTFTLRNAGTAALTSIAVSLTGTNASDFTVSNLVASVAAGASTTFTVTFKPASAGSRSAVLRITSNDADESTFDLNLAGTGIALPEIVVEKSDGTGLADGVSSPLIRFTQSRCAGITQSYTIRNTGTSALTGLALSLAGSNPADFTVSSLPSSLAAGLSTNFTLTFRPIGAGTRSASLRIASNDADENPFDINLIGVGGTEPEIAIESQEKATLASGVSFELFGQINLQAPPVTRLLTIRNLGSAPLTGITPAILSGHTSDFIFGLPGSATLAPAHPLPWRSPSGPPPPACAPPSCGSAATMVTKEPSPFSSGEQESPPRTSTSLPMENPLPAKTLALSVSAVLQPP